MHILVGVAAALATLAALYFISGTPAALTVALIVGFLASGIAYLARMVSNLVSEVDARRAQLLSEWLNQSFAAIGLGRSVTLVYSSRSSEGITLVQIPEARGADAQVLEALVFSSASKGEPIVRKTGKGLVAVVMAGRIAALLANAASTHRGRPILRISTPEQLKMLYKLLRSAYQALTGASRTLAAYLALKSIGRLTAQGLLSFTDWSIAEHALRYIPSEPPWISLRVKRQIARETHIQP